MATGVLAMLLDVPAPAFWSSLQRPSRILADSGQIIAVSRSKRKKAVFSGNGNLRARRV
jgi:hypothetical protein